MKALNRLAQSIDNLNNWVGNQVAWLTTILVVLICGDVVMRYLFNFSSAGVFELEWHIFALIFILGMGYTLRHDQHVRVDVFYSNFGIRTKAWINLLGSLLFLIPLCVVVIMATFKFVGNSYLIQESSPDPGGLPARYIIKSSIFVGFGLLLLQSFSLVIKSILTIFRPTHPHSN